MELDRSLYPRVSQILQCVPDVEEDEKRNISFVFKYKQIDRDILTNKQRIGTNVHSAIAHHLNDCYYPPLEADEQGYFDSFLVYNKILKLKPIITEERFYCDDLKFSGQVDLIYSSSKGAVLVDFKTSALIDKKKWPLQAAFYWYLCHKSGIDLLEEVMFIQLQKDGSKPVIERYNVDAKLKNAMVSVLNLYRYLLT